MDHLAQFLGETTPFDALTEPDLRRIADAAMVVDYAPGAEILDAFVAPTDDLFVVRSGDVDMWTTDSGPGEPAQERLGPGCVFGYSSALSGRAVGPRAVAAGPARVVRIPQTVVGPAFSSPAGLRLVANGLAEARVGARPGARYRTVEELVVSAPVLGTPEMSVAEAARRMTERSLGYLAVPVGEGEFGLVTDAVLRERVVAAGLSPDTPVRQVMIPRARSATVGTPTVAVLAELAEHQLDYLLVVEPSGALRGAVEPPDFLAAPAAAGMLLRERIQRAEDLDQVVALSRRLPGLLTDLVRQRREASETTAVYSSVVDAVQRRVLALALAQRADLDGAELTWVSLGSNARREPMLGSDIDSAVVFAESVDTPARVGAYRELFAEVESALRAAGLRVDTHGATPSSPGFARTRRQWRRAAQEWLRRPLDNQGMVMASLLLDGRPVHGDPAESAVREVFADVRDHPGTLRLLLSESLSHRARLRSVRDVLARRGDTFDLKMHALRPVVEIARWAALSVRSPELSTRARLAAASGSTLLPRENAETLIEVFEVLQRVRLSQQLAQLERGDRVCDIVWMPRLPALDRGLVAQSVREIAAVQRRLFNVLRYTSPQEWGRPDITS